MKRNPTLIAILIFYVLVGLFFVFSIALSSMARGDHGSSHDCGNGMAECPLPANPSSTG